MRVLIIGANGKIGKKLAAKLKKNNHEPVAMIRDQAQSGTFQNKGIKTVVADLEKDFEHAFEGVNAVVFTAGSGAHTGKDKTHLVDRIGAKKAIDLAVKTKVDRFVMVSAFRVDQPHDQWPEGMVHYFEAKADADKHLMQTNLNFTIIKPGRLTDENGTNNVQLAKEIEGPVGSIPRADVATVIDKVLDRPNTYRTSLALLSGSTPIDNAVAQIK